MQPGSGRPPREAPPGKAAVRRDGMAVPTRRHALAPAALRRVEAYVAEALGGTVTLAGMAKAARLSVFHFARGFRAEAGMTPRAYLAERRCERAKTLIAEGELTLEAIARSCGFAQQSHFTATFRRVTGVTPGRWRAARAAFPSRAGVAAAARKP